MQSCVLSACVFASWKDLGDLGDTLLLLSLRHQFQLALGLHADRSAAAVVGLRWASVGMVLEWQE